MIIYPIYPIAGHYDQNEKFDVSVIVPLYKSNKVILDQITQWHQDAHLKVEIIYVDDKCPTKSKMVVFQEWSKKGKKEDHNVTLVLSSKNKGFSGACNIGAMHARGKFLIFLNADTVVTNGWIQPMIDLFNDSKVGIVGNLQLKEGGRFHNTIDSAGSEWSWDFMNFMHVGRHFFNGKALDRPYKINNAPQDMLVVSEREMVTGCCFAIPKNLFNEVGGFDEGYKIGYWEDSELCMSIKELGYKIMFQPNSIIYHKLSHSNIGKHDHHESNRIRFFNKWVLSNKIDQFIKSVRPKGLNLTDEVVDRVSALQMSFYRNVYSNSIRWNGKDDLKEKTVIVYCEQGLGDTLQFVRYTKHLKQICKKIILHCALPLHSLFKDHLDGVDELLDKNNEILPFHDYHILSMSLPFLLQTPKEEFPYIKIKENTEIGYEHYFKIGIAWEGSPSHTNNKQRSCPLRHFKILEKIPNLKLFMLQDKIHLNKWLKNCEEMDINGVEINDFKDTAKLINSLDLIISVDTSILHLAGAMDKKAIALLSNPGDARWDVYNWYPSIIPIKQKKSGHWNSVFKELEMKVKELI